MCLTTSRCTGKTVAERLKKVIKIATRDIAVSKRLDKSGAGYVSPHQGTPWPKKGTQKVTGFGAVKHGRGLRIHQGLHAYTNISYSTYSGYHPAIIPKGTKYIVDASRAEIVALKLKVMFPVEGLRKDE